MNVTLASTDKVLGAKTLGTMAQKTDAKYSTPNLGMIVFPSSRKSRKVEGTLGLYPFKYTKPQLSLEAVKEEDKSEHIRSAINCLRVDINAC